MLKGLTARRCKRLAVQCCQPLQESDQRMTKSKHILPPRAMTLADRLERNSMPEPNSGCILWLGSCMPFGHGRMRWDGRLHLTHRLAWMAHRGEIPEGIMVCHKCDVPSCINPNHLFLGTNADNILDMYAKGRRVMTRGEKGPNAKLSDDQVRAIRADPRRQKLIAADFSICTQTVSSIKTRRYRSEVP